MLDTLQFQLRPSTRWVLANILGWSLGLTIGSLALSWTGGVFGLFLAGGILGFCGGLAQMLALPDELDRRWVVLSVVGGMIGALPVLLAAFTLVAGNTVGLTIMGAVFGLCFGWVQSFAISEYGGIWIAANVLGGGLCSVFSLTGFPFALPVCLTFGPVTFGLVTWGALMIWRRLLDEI